MYPTLAVASQPEHTGANHAMLLVNLSHPRRWFLANNLAFLPHGRQNTVALEPPARPGKAVAKSPHKCHRAE